MLMWTVSTTFLVCHDIESGDDVRDRGDGAIEPGGRDGRHLSRCQGGMSDTFRFDSIIPVTRRSHMQPGKTSIS